MAKLQGAQAFDEHFSAVYGDRWSDLKSALLQEECKVARRNHFYFEVHPEAQFEKSQGVGEELKDPRNCLEVFENFDLGHFDTPLLPFYRMDPASLYPAFALEAQPGERVLDMCAAPGGKSLVLIESMMGQGSFVANELSPKRRFRMMSVFKRYIPKEIRPMIQVRGSDGSRIGLKEKESYDRILLDAPCSGERGLMKKESELAQWKPKRPKAFGIRQYALLSSAFMALKPGGRIVYSTCSISPEENDRVIDKLEKRHGGSFEVVKPPFEKGESTAQGRIFLPDQCQGWGPIYFSVIQKK